MTRGDSSVRLVTADGIGVGPEEPMVASVGRRVHARRQAAAVPQYLVLADCPDEVVAVDMGARTVVRLRLAPGTGGPPRPRLRPFDVVVVPLSDVPEPADQAHPEARRTAGTPKKVGTLGGRRARALLKTVAAPAETHLLGFQGPAAPYWEFRGMHPSVAVVAPAVGPVVFRRRVDESTWARFGWPGNDNWLPVEDERVALALRAARRDRMSGKDLAEALGFRPTHLVVAVSAPRRGHCYKTVLAILPRP